MLIIEKYDYLGNFVTLRLILAQSSEEFRLLSKLIARYGVLNLNYKSNFYAAKPITSANNKISNN